MKNYTPPPRNAHYSVRGILQLNSFFRTLALFLILNLLQYPTKAQNGVPNQGECENLFFSELTFGKNPNGNFWDLNYAVEIYNPTGQTINLANYELLLTDISLNILSIPLVGNIAPGEVHVVSNADADLNLQSLADQIVAGMNFELYACLELKQSGVVLDKIGQKFNNNGSNNFDPVQFIQDPYGYLSNYDINLDDYQSVDIRRSYFDRKGDPIFSPAANAIIGHWAFYLNGDRSNIGSFNNICNPEADQFYIAYYKNYNHNPTDYRFELTNPGSSSSDGQLAINVYMPSNPPNGLNYPFTFNATHTYQLPPLSSATWKLVAPLFDCNGHFLTSNSFDKDISTNNLQKQNQQNLFGSNESVQFNNPISINPPFSVAMLQLSSTTPDVYTDAATDKIWIYFLKFPNAVQEFSKNNVRVFPTIFRNIIQVEFEEVAQYDYVLINSFGQALTKGKFNELKNSMELSGISQGIYFLKISNQNESYVIRLYKE